MAYARLAFNPEAKQGEFRAGHTIVQTTGGGAGATGTLLVGGDVTDREGYSFIVDVTAGAFTSGGWVNNPLTGAQCFIEYVGNVLDVNAAGGSTYLDIGNAGGAGAWNTAADGDAIYVIGAGTYDLPDTFNKRVAIYAARDIAVELRNNAASLILLTLNMSGVWPDRGWTEFVGVLLHQTLAEKMITWTAGDSKVLWSRCTTQQDLASPGNYLIGDAGVVAAASLFHFLRCNIMGGAPSIFFVSGGWTDYLIRGCRIGASVGAVNWLALWLYGRGITEDCLMLGYRWNPNTTVDGVSIVRNCIMASTVASGTEMMGVTSTSSARRSIVENCTIYGSTRTALCVHVGGGGESIVSGCIIYGGGGACMGISTAAAQTHRTYNNAYYNCAGGNEVPGAGATIISDGAVALGASPFVNAAAAPPDMRLNAVANGGELCKGIARRLPVVWAETDITGYPRDRAAKSDAGAYQSRSLISLRVGTLRTDEIGESLPVPRGFTGSRIVGSVSGATALVRDWLDMRIWDTDEVTGVRTVRAGSDAGILTVEYLTGGPFQAGETVTTMFPDYSDIPVGMVGSALAPYQPTCTALVDSVRAVYTVRTDWGAAVKLADGVNPGSGLVTGADKAVIWIDDSELRNDGFGIANPVQDRYFMAPRWHFPEFYHPTATTAMRTAGAGPLFRRVLFRGNPAQGQTIYAGGAGADLSLFDCEVYAYQPRPVGMNAYVGCTGRFDRCSFVSAYTSIGFIAGFPIRLVVLDTVCINSTRVLYLAPTASLVNGAYYHFERCTTINNSGNSPFFLDQVKDQTTVIFRNVCINSVTGGSTSRIVVPCVAAVALGTRILLEGISICMPSVASSPIYVNPPIDGIVKIRGVGVKSVAVAAVACITNAGAGFADLQYVRYHNLNAPSGNFNLTDVAAADPLFTSTASTPWPNLYPQAGSPLLGLVPAAAAVTSHYDVDGHPRRRRGTSVDAGAYERNRHVRLFLGFDVAPVRNTKPWFKRGDTITSSGGAVGVVGAEYGDDLIVDVISGVFANGETITNPTQTATATIVAVNPTATFSPRHDRDYENVTTAAGAIAHGTALMLRDGAVGQIYSAGLKRMLICRDPGDWRPYPGAGPIAHARVMRSCLHGMRYTMAMGEVHSQHFGTADYWLLTNTAAVEGWEGLADIVSAAASGSLAGIGMKGAGAGKRIMVTGCLLTLDGLGGGGNAHLSFYSLVADGIGRFKNSWARQVLRDHGFRTAGYRLVATYLGTTLHSDVVFEDLGLSAAFYPYAGGGTHVARRCVFRRMWEQNSVVFGTGAMELHGGLVYNHEQSAAFTTLLQSIALAVSGKILASSVLTGPRVGNDSPVSLVAASTSELAGCLFQRTGDNAAGGRPCTGAGATAARHSIQTGHFATFQAGTLDNTADADPLFVSGDPQTPDIHLQDASPAIGFVTDPLDVPVAVNMVDLHGVPWGCWTPNPTAGAVIHPIPGRIPLVKRGQRRRLMVGGVKVPPLTHT